MCVSLIVLADVRVFSFLSFPWRLPGRLAGRSPLFLLRTAALRTAVLLIVLAGGIHLYAPAVQAQPDSTRQAILRAKGLPMDHTPRGALWRAAAIPGWGQLYNRQYYKMPFVYLGLAGGVAAVLYTHDQYKFYQEAHLFRRGEDLAAGEEGGMNEYAEFEPVYNEALDRFGTSTLQASFLRSQRERFRRFRDLSVIGTGLFYAFTILDSYVSAHLLTFDVGEELSMDVYPTNEGTTATLRVRF